MLRTDDNCAVVKDDGLVYTPQPPARRHRRWLRWSPLWWVVLGSAAVAVVVVSSVGWRVSSAIRTTLSPPADGQLRLLRAVPRPVGAVEVGHRLQRGTYDTKPTAWLTYRLPQPACPASLAAFATHGVVQAGHQAADEVKAYCKPPGRGFESFCLPRVVCFFADFASDHDVLVYTISTGPDGEG